MDYNVYEEHIKVLNEKIGMPEEYGANVLEYCKKICADDAMSSKYLEIQDKYFNQHEADTLESIHLFAERYGFEKHMLTLTFCEMYSLYTLEIYKMRNYPMDVFYDSFKDLVIWGNVCKNQHGTFGIANYGWVSEQIRATMFRLGRLQFHYITYNEETYTHAGVTVKKGDTVLNIHIPEGESLTAEKRLDSYRKAYKFFGQTGNAVFVCDSWLLYPGHKEFLDPKSNILGFMSDFDVTSYRDKNSSEGFGDSWRIFGFLDSYAPETLPRNTGLQKAYAKRFEENGKVGAGFGIFIFDGEKRL